MDEQSMSDSSYTIGSEDTIGEDSIDKISEAQLYNWINSDGSYINNCIDEDGLKCHEDSVVCEHCEKYWIAYCEWDEKVNNFEFIVPDDEVDSLIQDVYTMNINN